MLDVLAAADRERALVMVHAENHEMIQWLTKKLLARGHGAPKYHMTAHHALAEAEATHRVVALSRLLDVPVLIVHVSGGEAAKTIRAAQALGARVFAETCPQYLFLEGDDADKPGLEGAKWCCSPPPRDKASQEAVWQGLKDGTFHVLSSDHAPYRFDESGKLPKGDKTTFKDMANGVPGLQVRLPLLFSEGVGKKRISLE
jgi:dihydropyrimidinase